MSERTHSHQRAVEPRKLTKNVISSRFQTFSIGLQGSVGNYVVATTRVTGQLLQVGCELAGVL